MIVAALYFDGKSSRAYRVELTVQQGIASIRGDIKRDCPIAQLRVSERMHHAARKVTYPDGAYLEIQDKEAFSSLLHATGHRDSVVVRMQQSWRSTLAAAVATIAVLAAGYLHGLPGLSAAIAKALPEKVERTLGAETLSFLDSKWMEPSVLPEERQAAIRHRFRQLRLPAGETPAYEILFRKSRLGPNAFALPSGQIILTDEIIRMVGNDEETILAILAHELGHLHERHITQRIIQGSIIGVTAAALFGDVSSLLATIPTLMMDMKYSREAEHEADDFAVTLLKANGISPAKLALVFEKLREMEPEPGQLSAYLSSHPSSGERVMRIQKAQ